MAKIKVVYVSPGEILDIRIMTDADLPKNNKEWMYQVRPSKLLITIAASDHIKLLSGMGIKVEEADAVGKTVRYRN